MKGTASDARLASVALDGAGARADAAGRFDLPWRLHEGANEAVIEAEDTVGNRSEKRLRATLDTRPPKVTVRGPAEVEGDTASIEVESDEDLSAIEVNGTRRTASGRRVPLNVPVPEGGATVVARAFDAAGNAGEERVAIRRKAVENVGYAGERMPKGMRRGSERGVYVWDTGKGLEIEMVYVPPGDFVMGSEDSDAHDDEKPRHTHPMPKGYYIGRYETTWREYRASGRAEPEAPSWGKKDDHPVVNVSWDDADAFCKWAGLELPTEAQWEKAARGTDGRKYPWGNDPPTAERCVWDGHPTYGDKSTAPVGTCPKGASPYGVQDMAGNVWEWCASGWEANYQRYKNGDF